MTNMVLITGASSGIGEELAKIFASSGDDLVLIGRNRKKLEAVVKKLEKKNKTAKHYIFIADLSKKGAAEEIHSILNKEGIAIDILVNNAGFGNAGYFDVNNLEDESDMLMVNVMALMQFTKVFLPQLIERRGRILNVGSVASFLPIPKLANYSASKAYVLSFSESLAVELKNRGVSVSVLCPGPTITGFQKQAGMKEFKKSGNGVQTSKEVAEIGYKGLMKGKRVIVPGKRNKLALLAPRILPRRLLLMITNKAMSERSLKKKK